MKTTIELAKELGLLRKRSSNGSRKYKTCQIFSYLIVIDYESTCWEDSRYRSQEIIEFPAVLLNTTSGEIESEFHYYVQPQENPVLSKFCKDLTGITQEQVEEGIPLSMCLRKFSQWLTQISGEKNFTYSDDNNQPGQNLCTFVTWSDWDLGVCLKYETQRKQLRRPPELNSWIDLRSTYRKFYDRKPNGLIGALEDIGISFEGREHSGIVDARNTAILAYRMICDGCILTVTKTITPVSKEVIGQNFTGTKCEQKLATAVETVRTCAPQLLGPRNPQRTCSPQLLGPTNPQRTCAPQLLGPTNPQRTCFPQLLGPTNPRRTYSATVGNFTIPCKGGKDNQDSAFARSGKLHNIENSSSTPTLTSEAKALQSNNMKVSVDENLANEHVETNSSRSFKLRQRNCLDKPGINLERPISQNTHSCLLEQSKTISTAQGLHVGQANSVRTSALNTTASNHLKLFKTPGFGLLPKSTMTSGKKVLVPASTTPNVFKIPSPVNFTTDLSLTTPSPSRNNNSSFNQGFMNDSIMHRTPPMCECGRRTNRKVVQQPGPNMGRSFYCCPAGRSSNKKRGCGFFKWESVSRRNSFERNDSRLSSNVSRSPDLFSPLSSDCSAEQVVVSPMVQPNFNSPSISAEGNLTSVLKNPMDNPSLKNDVMDNLSLKNDLMDNPSFKNDEKLWNAEIQNINPNDFDSSF